MKKLLLLMSIIPFSTISISTMVNSTYNVKPESPINLGDIKFTDTITIDFKNSGLSSDSTSTEIHGFCLKIIKDYLNTNKNKNDNEIILGVLSDLEEKGQLTPSWEKVSFVNPKDDPHNATLTLTGVGDKYVKLSKLTIDLSCQNSETRIQLNSFNSIFKYNPLEINGNNASTITENILRQEYLIIYLADKYLIEQKAKYYTPGDLIDDLENLDINIDLNNKEQTIPLVYIQATQYSKHFSNGSSLTIPITINVDILRYEEQLNISNKLHTSGHLSNVNSEYKVALAGIAFEQQLGVDITGFRKKYNKIEFVITGLITDWEGKIIKADKVFFIDVKKLTINKSIKENIISFSKHDGLAYEQATMSVEYQLWKDQISFHFTNEVKIKITSLVRQGIDYNYNIKSILIK